MAERDEEFLTKEGGRFGAMQSFYYEMCQDLYTGYLEQEAALEAFIAIQEPRALDGYESLAEEHEEGLIEGKLEASAIKIIVIAGMCLEAAIYDYAAWHLPQRTVNDQLDKLDLYAKWSLVPLIVAQRELAADGAAMSSLKTLVRLRNMLVHSKSKAMPFDLQEREKMVTDLRRRSDEIIAGGHEAMRAIILLSLEMDYRFGGRTINPLPQFADRNTPLVTEFPIGMKPLLDKCREIVGKLKRKEKTEMSI